MRSLKQWWTDYKYHVHKCAMRTKVEYACEWLIKEYGLHESYSDVTKYISGAFTFCYKASYFSGGIYHYETYWLIYKDTIVYDKVGDSNYVTFLYGPWVDDVVKLHQEKYQEKYKNRFGEYVEK